MRQHLIGHSLFRNASLVEIDNIFLVTQLLEDVIDHDLTELIVSRDTQQADKALQNLFVIQNEVLHYDEVVTIFRFGQFNDELLQIVCQNEPSCVRIKLTPLVGKFVDLMLLDWQREH